MNAFRRQHFAAGRGSRRTLRRRSSLDRSRAAALIGDAPDAATDVIGDIERTVRPDRETRWAMRGLPRVLVRARETVCEHDVFAGRLAVLQRLEHDVVAALRRWRAIPRAMERDECAALIAVRKRAALINRKIV